MVEFIIYYTDVTTANFLVGLALSVFLGVVIGSERELRNKDAGMSTHALVISGAMLFTFLSGMVDPASQSRIAAQIVTGIGFLGAGLIIKEGSSVKNLTTAASLWSAAAIGMAIGYGFYAIAIIASLASTFIPRLPHLKPEGIPAIADKLANKKLAKQQQSSNDD